MSTNFEVKRDQLEVQLSRVFNATPEKIWSVISNPELVPQWWGPKNLSTTVDKMDFRVGGEWRFIHKDANGNEYGFHGVYKQIEEPKLVSDTFNYEGIPGDHELVETMTLEDLGNNQTKMTTVSKYATIEDLDGMVNSGMEGGATESWERLAAIC